MQLEVGGIYEGKVTGITKFGAFVSFEGGQTGMVHISEVAPTFVTEIRDFVTEGQTVKVKVLSINEEGKRRPCQRTSSAGPPAGRTASAERVAPAGMALPAKDAGKAPGRPASPGRRPSPVPPGPGISSGSLAATTAAPLKR